MFEDKGEPSPPLEILETLDLNFSPLINVYQWGGCGVKTRLESIKNYIKNKTIKKYEARYG